MGIDLGNLAALRTFRVLRALKTVAIVPGEIQFLWLKQPTVLLYHLSLVSSLTVGNYGFGVSSSEVTVKPGFMQINHLFQKFKLCVGGGAQMQIMDHKPSYFLFRKII